MEVMDHHPPQGPQLHLDPPHAPPVSGELSSSLSSSSVGGATMGVNGTGGLHPVAAAAEGPRPDGTGSLESNDGMISGGGTGGGGAPGMGGVLTATSPPPPLPPPLPVQQSQPQPPPPPSLVRPNLSGPVLTPAPPIVWSGGTTTTTGGAAAGEGAPGPAPACAVCRRHAEDGRPLLHFVPVPHETSVMHSAPTVRTFTDRLFLHVFCGKTASILPHVNQPGLEILSKAGLKNKHGTGPEVNAALARTRSALLDQPNDRCREFYLVREFEAHLAAVRHCNIGLLGLLPVASADPYGNWRGPHQQYLLEQQQLEQQQQEQQQQEEGDAAEPTSEEEKPPQQHDPSDLGAHANGDLLLGLQHLADSSLSGATASSSALHPFPPPIHTGSDPAADSDAPAVNDEENDAQVDDDVDDDDDVHLGGDGRQPPSPVSTPLVSGLFQDSAASMGAASASSTTTSDAPSSFDKKRGLAPSPTSPPETEYYKIPRKRLASTTSSNSTSTPPSRDGGALHASPSLLLGSNSNGSHHFLDQPSFAYSAGTTYRNGNSSLSPRTPNNGVQPLYHSMLMSSAASALDPSLLALGNGLGSSATAWSRMMLNGAAAGALSSPSHDVPRIRCGCGGSHLPADTAKGMLSWRTHAMTKRHQKWLRSQGRLGAV